MFQLKKTQPVFWGWRLMVAALVLSITVSAVQAETPPKKESGGVATKPLTPEAKAAAEAQEAKKRKDDEEYYQLLELFADSVDQIERNYVKGVSRRELMEAAIRGMVSKLDQHSMFIPPAEIDRFKGDVESEFGGIGIQVTMEEEQLKVISPLPGTPAFRAGIVAGDRIVKIGAKATKGIALDECVKLMKGREGTSVTITIQHKGASEPQTLTLKREVVKVQTVQGDRRTGEKWNYLYDAEQKIGYIRVSSFSRHTSDELSAALKELTGQKMKGLVLDLRFNPGGLLSSAIEVSDLFVTEGRIVSTSGRNVHERAWEAKKQGTFVGFPMVVLVNKYSASASEIVSACLQDHQRAVVIGERSYGKGSVQNIVELEEGKSALKLTTASYKRPSGKNIHRFEGAKDSDEWGVSPDAGFEVKMSDDEARDYFAYRRYWDQLQHEQPEAKPGATPTDQPPQFDDKQLKKALEYLKEQMAKKPDSLAREEDAASKAGG